jgi:hypothetical protein
MLLFAPFLQHDRQIERGISVSHFFDGGYLVDILTRKIKDPQIENRTNEAWRR